MLYRSKRFIFTLLLSCLVLVFILSSFLAGTSEDEIVWSMVHVSGKKFSGDAHLLEFPDGRAVLIDTGFARFTSGDLIPYLDSRGISYLDQLIVTHAHRNHYGGVGELIQHLDGIGSVVFNLPAAQACDAETWATACDYGHVLNTRGHITKSGIPLHQANAGDTLFEDEPRDIRLRVLHAHDGKRQPLGRTDINDTSLVMRLSFGDQSVLFTGDTNQGGGKYLVEQGIDLHATIVTAPHHGVESAALNEFLDQVGAEAVMVSNSWVHWNGDRGRRMRDYFAANNVPVYVSGRDGVVTVNLRTRGYTINVQNADASD